MPSPLIKPNKKKTRVMLKQSRGRAPIGRSLEGGKVQFGDMSNVKEPKNPVMNKGGKAWMFLTSSSTKSSGEGDFNKSNVT